MSTAKQRSLSDINDDSTEQELILIIITSSAFLLTIFFMCGFILYYYFSNKSKHQELYRLERHHQHNLNNEISDIVAKIHEMKHQIDGKFTFNKIV